MYTMYSTETSREYSVSNIETLGSAWALPFFLCPFILNHIYKLFRFILLTVVGDSAILGFRGC